MDEDTTTVTKNHTGI